MCNTVLGKYASYRTNFLASLNSTGIVLQALENEMSTNYAAAKLTCDRMCGATSMNLPSKGC